MGGSVARRASRKIKLRDENIYSRINRQMLIFCSSQKIGQLCWLYFHSMCYLAMDDYLHMKISMIIHYWNGACMDLYPSIKIPCSTLLELGLLFIRRWSLFRNLFGMVPWLENVVIDGNSNLAPPKLNYPRQNRFDSQRCWWLGIL